MLNAKTFIQNPQSGVMDRGKKLDILMVKNDQALPEGETSISFSFVSFFPFFFLLSIGQCETQTGDYGLETADRCLKVKHGFLSL